jgi:hypothetical protein
MKVGDLVRLSAYGKKRVRAEWIDNNDVGLITKVIVHLHPALAPDYVVRWRRSVQKSNWQWGSQRSNTRKDLKYVK